MTDVGAMTECPKCGLKASPLLHNFCTHAVCPVRAAVGPTAPVAGVDRDMSLVERLRLGGPNAAEVSGEAADEIERLQTLLDVFERYCNRDVRAQIADAFETKRTTGKFPFED